MKSWTLAILAVLLGTTATAVAAKVGDTLFVKAKNTKVVAKASPTADVVAATVLRCLVVPAHDLKPMLLSRPSVAYRMLQIEARRLRAANTWAG